MAHIFSRDSMILTSYKPPLGRGQGLCHIIYVISIVYSGKIQKNIKKLGSPWKNYESNGETRNFRLISVPVLPKSLIFF